MTLQERIDILKRERDEYKSMAQHEVSFTLGQFAGKIALLEEQLAAEKEPQKKEEKKRVALAAVGSAKN